MIYNIVLTGHLLRVFKPAGWPDTVTYNHMVEASSFPQLREQVDVTVSGIIKQRGFLYLEDSVMPLEDSVKTLNNRIYVPMHMISHITTEVKTVSRPLPDEKQRLN